MEVVIALIATAISFIDSELTKVPPTSNQAFTYIDAKGLLVATINILRDEPNKVDVVTNVHERIKNRRKSN